MCIRHYATVAAVTLFSGCAIHPVPEDVTGVNTYHIARQIRCETRAAAIAMVIRRLEALARGGETQAPDPIATRLLSQYESDPESISTFNANVLFPGPEYIEVRHFFNVVYSAAVAYTFDLKMTEQNDLGTNVNFLGAWAAKFTLGVGANANRQRTNERTFTLTDRFDALLMGLNTPVRGQRYCDRQIVQANYIYPIAGRIGVDEQVKTFFELILFANLGPKGAAAGATGAPAMADDLTFTTTVDLSATPKVVFAPAPSGFQIADASLTGLARRTDVHQVTVGLAIEPSAIADLGSLRGFLFSSQRSAGVAAASGSKTRGSAGNRVLVLNRVTAVANTKAEQLAVQAIDQLKSREFQLIPAP